MLSFQCPAGYRKKCNSIVGSSVDVCCVATRGVITCPYGSEKFTYSSSLKDAPAESGCKPTCDSITCSAGYAKKERPETCDVPCSVEFVNGRMAYYKRYETTSAAAYLKCLDHVADKGTPLGRKCMLGCQPSNDMLSAGKQSLSSSEPGECTCCEMTCEAFSCPDGQPSKTEAALLRSPNTEQCCEPSCKLFSCPMGLLKKPSFIKTDGFATEACCDATCTACPKTRGWTFQCKKGFLLREDAGSVVAGSAQLAPERCCRPTCAGFLAHSASS